jgi:hypothetical protein
MYGSPPYAIGMPRICPAMSERRENISAGDPAEGEDPLVTNLIDEGPRNTNGNNEMSKREPVSRQFSAS